MQPYFSRSQLTVVRHVLVCATGLLTLASSVSSAHYPDTLIRLIVPCQPGGATDVIGRVMAQKMPAALVAQEKPDGNIKGDQAF